MSQNWGYADKGGQMEIYLDFVIETEAFGPLKFATVNIGRLAKTERLLKSSQDSRTICVMILHNYLMEPKLSAEELGSLSDTVLEDIGRNLLNKSRLGDRLDEATVKDSGFFAAFNEAHKHLLSEQQKSSAKWNLFSAGTWSKAAIEAMYPRNLFLLEEINRAKDLMKDIERSRSMLNSFAFEKNAAMQMAEAFRVQEKSITSAFKSVDRDFSKINDIAKSLFIPGAAEISQNSWFLKSLTSNLHEMMDIGKSMSKEMATFSAMSAAADISRYQDIWKSVNVPSFVDASINVVDEFIEEASADENVPAEDMGWLESIRESLMQHKDTLPHVKNSAEFGKLVVDFIGMINIVNNMWMQRIITPETGALVIMHFYFALVIFVCNLLQERE